MKCLELHTVKYELLHAQYFSYCLSKIHIIRIQKHTDGCVKCVAPYENETCSALKTRQTPPSQEKCGAEVKSIFTNY